MHLEEESASFPRHVILVVELPEEDEAAAKACGGDELMPPRAPEPEDLVNAPEVYTQDIGGRCVDFTKPNRTLEEFDTYFVVRTTDPDIGPHKRRSLSAEAREQILERYGQYDLPAHLKAQRAIREGGLQRVDPRGQQLRREAFTDNLGNRYVLVGAESGTGAAGGSSVGTGSAASPTSGGGQATPLDAAAVINALQKGERGSLEEMEVRSVQRALKDVVLYDSRPASGRRRLDADNPVDWDEGPTLAQARTIAHGHILHYKQVWRADGYSLGDLLYSLPLAPCQKKHIAIVDWERRDLGSRSEERRYSESLQAELSHDRDISEIVNAGLDEHYDASSSASSWSTSASLGGLLGDIFSLGVSGGGAGSSSQARQDSSRNTAAAAVQKIRERTQQSASSVRSQRATVVKQVRQGEAVTATTEVVANHNHCHAITMEYFEVLRHFIVSQELVDVQECLFVPLMMSEFDEAKALRWREILSRHLLKRDMRGHFSALERFHENDYEGMPEGIMADEPLEFIDGELTLRMMIAPPPRPKDDELKDLSEGVVAPRDIYFNTIIGPVAIELDQDPHDLYAELSRDEALFNQIFQERYAPRLAERLIGEIKVYLSDNNLYHDAPLDATLVSDYQPGGLLVVRLNFNGGALSITRSALQEIRLSLPADVKAWLTPLSKIVVERAHFGYRTRNLATSLYHSTRVGDRLDVGDDVTLWTGQLNALERRNPRRGDAEHARALIDHLNEYIEYYHKAIWARMDSARRFMLLDGFEAPNAPGGRSVASVVENRLIGIVGNSLVMPVAPGYQLDPCSRRDPENPTTLLEQYAPLTPPAPMRIAIPTKGVFAESVMGACNSCEKKDDTRFWRWEESACPDNPTPINPVDTGSRYRDIGDLKASDFPSPIINLQNAPGLPDPTGLQQAMGLLSNPNLFKDMTGLDANQANALKALSESLGASSRAGEKAVDMAHASALRKDRDQYLEGLQRAKEEGLLDAKQVQERANDYFQSSLFGTSPPPVVAKKPNSSTMRVEFPEQRNQRCFFTESGEPLEEKTTLVVNIVDQPVKFEWAWLDKKHIQVLDDKPLELSFGIQAVVPGVHQLDMVVNGLNDKEWKESVEISVPLLYEITQEQQAFDAALSLYGLQDYKDRVIAVVKDVVNYLLRSINVRLHWDLDGDNPLPDLFASGEAKGLYNKIIIHNKRGFDLSNDVDVSSIKGFGDSFWGLLTKAYRNIGGEAPAVDLSSEKVFGEIEIYLAAYDHLDIEIGDALHKLYKARQTTLSATLDVDENVRLIELHATMLSRLIASTMGHEILHTIIGHHNDPSIPLDLLNEGFGSLQYETGIEVLDKATFPAVGSYQDHFELSQDLNHVVEGMARVTEQTQMKVDMVLPVPENL